MINCGELEKLPVKLGCIPGEDAGIEKEGDMRFGKE